MFCLTMRDTCCSQLFLVRKIWRKARTEEISTFWKFRRPSGGSLHRNGFLNFHFFYSESIFRVIFIYRLLSDPFLILHSWTFSNIENSDWKICIFRPRSIHARSSWNRKQLFSRKMLNKRKLKYNFGTECILLKTIYNREYICVKTKGEIYIWLNSVLFPTFCCNDRMIKAFFILCYSFSSISSIFIHFQKILHSYTSKVINRYFCSHTYK